MNLLFLLLLLIEVQFLIYSVTMTVRNAGVCHSCKRQGHYFAACTTKRPCPSCRKGIVKCFEVEKESINKERLFNICSIKCGFWKWVE